MQISRILLALMLIVGAGGAVVTGTGAFFNDTETSTGNTFTAGDIDLTIDNESYYNGVFNPGTSWAATDLLDHKFFDFDDLKPGDYGEDTISIHVATNDAYMCANVTLTSNDDNGLNEPEALVDQTDGPGNGELAALVNFAWWADDGDNVYEVDEELIDPIGPIGALTLDTPYPLALADADENIWTGNGGPILGNVTHYIGKAWCFGTMAANPLPQDDYAGPDADNNNNATAGEAVDGGFTCDGSLLGNESQTDSLTADISFEAVQARNNPNFQCDVPEIFETCTNPELAYADTVVSSDIGERKNGTPVAADRSDPNDALGAPQSTGTPFDNPVVAGSFFSLGFDEGDGDGTPNEGGKIVLSFADNVIVDGPGNDIRLWEVTGGTSYPVEKVKIEVSQDGVSYVTLASSLDRDAEANLAGSGLAWAKYIRITDVSPIAPFEATADGYDLDAVSALNCGVPLGQNGPVIN